MQGPPQLFHLLTEEAELETEFNQKTETLVQKHQQPSESDWEEREAFIREGGARTIRRR